MEYSFDREIEELLRQMGQSQEGQEQTIFYLIDEIEEETPTIESTLAEGMHTRPPEPRRPNKSAKRVLLLVALLLCLGVLLASTMLCVVSFWSPATVTIIPDTQTVTTTVSLSLESLHPQLLLPLV